MFNLSAYALSLQTFSPPDLSITHARHSKCAALVSSSSSLGTGGNYAYVQREVKDMLLPISKLRNGWHGPKSIGIADETALRTLQLVSLAASAGMFIPEITPNPHGTITLEWESQHASLSLEVGKTKASGYFKTDGNDPTLISDANGLSSAFFGTVRSILIPSASFTVRGQIEPSKFATA